MMPNDNFCQDRLQAAKMFAQTMIVIDDEATLEPVGAPGSNNLIKPKLGDQRAEESNNVAVSTRDIDHVLDAKAIMDGAMENGLICSALNFRKGETQKQLAKRVLLTATRVDIVCLDWEIHDNEGDIACSLINEIARHDQEQSGRLRLIAIYTGERGRPEILKQIVKKVNNSSEELKSRMKLEITDDREICSAVGLKIVCLFKKHGRKLTGDLESDQISESELPERLLKEFSKLSEGLLSNVALGTIAKIRDVTHQVVGSFNGDMDGPYFQHRATIAVPNEAEEYAINIVISKLSNTIKLQKIGRSLAGKSTLKRRVESIADGRPRLKFLHKSEKDDNAGHENIKVDDVMSMILDGFESAYNSINFNRTPSKRNFKKYFSSLFVSSIEETERLMKKFDVLTAVRSHAGDYTGARKNYCPELCLRTVVLDPNNEYWLCLQASCDSVRLEDHQAFLFVPLKEEEKRPEHIVPDRTAKINTEFTGLKVPDKGYTKMKSFDFKPNSMTQTILAERSKTSDSLYFKCTKGQEFTWIAQLKERQALRTVSKIGQHMSRAGFDEFEPFRS